MNLSAALRHHAEAWDRSTTHSGQCWKWHTGCALILAADELDWLQARIATFEGVMNDEGAL